MKEKDHLFQLIKNLSANEKGYFRKYGFKNQTKASDKIQLQLFTWLSKQTAYDEEKTKKQLFNKNEKEYRVVKHHLYQRIVSCLLDYSKDDGVENSVWRKTASAKILTNKGQYASAKKVAESAVDEALLAERYDLAYTALVELRNTNTNLRMDEETYLFSRFIEEKQQYCLDCLKNISAYKRVFEEIKLVESKMGVVNYLNDELTQQMENLFNLPLLQNIEEAVCFESMCLFYVCRTYCFIAFKQKAKVRETTRVLVMLMEAHPEKQKYYLVKYRTAINQYLNTSFSLKAFDDFDFYIEKLEKSMQGAGPYLEARGFIMIMNLKINKNFATDAFEENINLINGFEKQLQTHEALMSPESFAVLYINCMAAFFYLGKYKGALVYVNKLLNELDTIGTKALITVAKCANLIIHFELRNTELLHYLLKVYSDEAAGKTGLQQALAFLCVLVQKLEKQNNKSRNSKAHLELQSGWEELLQNKSIQQLLSDTYVDVWIKKRMSLA